MIEKFYKIRFFDGFYDYYDVTFEKNINDNTKDLLFYLWIENQADDIIFN